MAIQCLTASARMLVFSLGSFLSPRNATFIGFSPMWRQLQMCLSAGQSSFQELSMFLGVSREQVHIEALSALLADFFTGHQLKMH